MSGLPSGVGVYAPQWGAGLGAWSRQRRLGVSCCRMAEASGVLWLLPIPDMEQRRQVEAGQACGETAVSPLLPRGF